jgi:excisionase family DNA binding protein
MNLADQIEKIDHALKAQEVAVLLNVSPQLIYEQAKAGRIPSFKVGFNRRFDPKAVAEWLRRQ